MEKKQSELPEVEEQEPVAEEAGKDVAEPTQDEESYKLQFQRVAADFENYRRRMERERVEWALSARIHVLKEVIPALDDLDRAVDALDGVEGSELEGWRLIQKNLRKTLEKLGVSEIDTSNGFDPELHEALSQVPSEQHESGQIVDVLERGYQLNGKVIRYARVAVAQ